MSGHTLSANFPPALGFKITDHFSFPIFIVASVRGRNYKIRKQLNVL
jgi:hypothetical protein